MINIDKSLINEDIKAKYLKYYETILSTIKDTYNLIFYMQAIQEKFGGNKYVKTYAEYEYFLLDVMKLIQEKICLNICKLILDEGEDVLTLRNMKGFIRRNLNTTVYVKNIRIDNNIETSIKNIRNDAISHNIYKEDKYQVQISDLKQILDKAVVYFKELWIDDFLDRTNRVLDDYFTYNDHLYKNSVKDALKGIIT
ncbi:MAG: hypothetical protein K2J83_00680 [Clostridia bacterium]|nr:hypothetical protein [Clostridia bacterium]